MNKKPKIFKETLVALKGFMVGASMLLPGVSGGTMAIILGIYEQLIHSVNVLTTLFKFLLVKFLNLFRKNKKAFDINKSQIKNALVTVVIFGVFAVAGMLIFARLIENAIKLFYIPMHYLFMGAILGGVPTLYRKANADGAKTKFSDIVFACIGFVIVCLISVLPKNLFTFDEINIISFILLIIAGVVIAIALILPGISTSQMLLLLGLYDLVLDSLSNYSFLILIPLVFGVIAGTLLTTDILERAMNNNPRATYFFIIGFVVGSIIDVFPSVPKGTDIVYSFIMFLVGFTVIFFLSKFSNKR